MGQSSRKILIILAVVVVLVVLYFFFIYRPKSIEITNYLKDLNEIKRDKEEKQKIVADLEQFNREVMELEKRLQEALAQLPNENEGGPILTRQVHSEMSNFSIRSGKISRIMRRILAL